MEAMDLHVFVPATPPTVKRLVAASILGRTVLLLLPLPCQPHA
jgi:hypothetical protein